VQTVALYGGTFWVAIQPRRDYKFVAPTTMVTLVHFTGTNGLAKGHGPGVQLLLARDGWFLRVTEEGGSFDRGTVFRSTRRGRRFAHDARRVNGTNGAQARLDSSRTKTRPGPFMGPPSTGETEIMERSSDRPGRCLCAA